MTYGVVEKPALRIRKLISAVTGPSLFNFRVYLFFLPAFWITSLLSNLHNFSFFNLGVWTVANILAMAICWVLLLFADRRIFTNRKLKPANILAVLTFALFIGATKGSATIYLAWLLGAEAHLDTLWPRTVQAAILGLVTLPALAILAASFKRFQNERDALVAERVSQASNSATFESGKIRLEIDRLRSSISDVKHQLSGNSESRVPALLKDVVHEQLRPLAQRLWEEQKSNASDFSFKNLSRLAVLNRPFAGTAVAGIVSTGILIPYLQETGVGEGILRSLATGTVIWLAYWAASKVRPASIAGSAAYFVLFNFATATAVVVVSDLLFGTLANYPTAVAVAVMFVWITQTGFMTGFVKSTLETRAEIRRQLEQLAVQLGVDAEVIHTKNQLVSRELANHIHGNVQNKLLLLAFKLDRGEGENLQAELEQIDSMLALLQKPLTAITTSASLTDLAQRWQGFANLEIEVSQMCQLCESRSDIVRIVEEAANNSIRHGLAHTILVSVVCLSDDVVIQVTDDGIGPRAGAVGLGSKYFSTVSGQNWSLKALSQGGSKLTLALRH